MRLGLTISLFLHAAIVAWALLGLRAARDFKPPETIPIALEIVTDQELNALNRAGKETSKILDASADKTEKSELEKEVKKPTPPKPKQASAPPPEQPKPEPEPPAKEPEKPVPPADPKEILKEMAKTEPVKPEPPKPEPVKDEAKPEDVLEAMKQTEPKPPSPEELKKIEEQKKAEAKRIADEKLKQKKLAEAKEKERLKKLAEAAAKKKLQDAAKSQSALDKIAADLEQENQKALIDKSPPKPTAAATASTNPAKSPLKVAAGVANGTGAGLSNNELGAIINALRNQIKPCLTVVTGAQDADKILVRARVRFNQDGSINGQPQLVEPQNSPLYLIASESVVSAVMRCAPYNLPADKYSFWQDVILRLDQKDLF